MSEGHSKFIIPIEALVLLVPTTAVAFWFWLFNLRGGHSLYPLPGWQPHQAYVLILLPTISLVCCWILVFRFFVYGSRALLFTSRWIWFAAIYGGIVAVAAVVDNVAIRFGNVGIRAALPDYFGLLVIGSPALIPLVHVTLERLLRRTI